MPSPPQSASIDSAPLQERRFGGVEYNPTVDSRLGPEEGLIANQFGNDNSTPYNATVPSVIIDEAIPHPEYHNGGKVVTRGGRLKYDESDLVAPQHASFVEEGGSDSGGPKVRMALSPEKPKKLKRALRPLQEEVPCVQSLQKKIIPWYGDTYVGNTDSATPAEWPYQTFFKEIKARWADRRTRGLLIFRAAAIAVGILIFLLSNVVFAADLFTVQSVPRIWDYFHELFGDLNHRMQTHHLDLSLLIFFSSFFMDITLLIIFFLFIATGDSCRLPVALAIFYGLRALMRYWTLLPFPAGYIWETPTFKGVRVPSLAVGYQASDDFFFSGHVGCATLVAVEHIYCRRRYLAIFTFAVILLESFTMLVTRGHYTCDIFTGAVTGSWVHMICQIISEPIDRWLRLPPRPLVTKAPINLTHTHTSLSFVGPVTTSSNEQSTGYRDGQAITGRDPNQLGSTILPFNTKECEVKEGAYEESDDNGQHATTAAQRRVSLSTTAGNSPTAAVAALNMADEDLISYSSEGEGLPDRDLSGGAGGEALLNESQLRSPKGQLRVMTSAADVIPYGPPSRDGARGLKASGVAMTKIYPSSTNSSSTLYRDVQGDRAVISKSILSPSLAGGRSQYRQQQSPLSAIERVV